MAWSYYYDQLNKRDKAVYDSIYRGLCSFTAEIIIDPCNKNVGNIYREVLRDHPELACVDTLFYPVGDSSDGAVLFEPTFLFPSGELYSKTMSFMDEVEFVANRITTKKASDYEKELAIHDFIMTNVKYGFPKHSDNDVSGSRSQSAYFALLEKTAICRGISGLFKCLADLVGLECYIIVGEIMKNNLWEDHAWNVVKVDGKYSFVDVTYDIGNYTGNNMVSYAGMNFSRDEAKRSYRWNENDHTAGPIVSNGYCEHNAQIVADMKDLSKVIRIQVNKFNNKKGTFFFKLASGSEISYEPIDRIANKIDDILFNMDLECNYSYVADPDNGNWSVKIE